MSRPQVCVDEETPVIGRRTAWFLIVGFVAMMTVPVLHQAWRTRGGNFVALARLVCEQPTAEKLHAFEKDLAKESLLAQKTRRLYHAAMLTALRCGSEQVVVGHDGFLFYRTDVEYCAGQSQQSTPIDRPDTYVVAAEHLVKLNAQLKNRGIHLIVAPIPVSPSIYPEKIWPGYQVTQGPASNPRLAEWQSSLHQHGVEVVDLTSALWAAKLQGETKLFIAHNTHWSPEGARIAGGAVADQVRPLIRTAHTSFYREAAEQVRLPSDLLPMLELPQSWRHFRQDNYVVNGIVANQQSTGNEAAPVLLLGDSFSTIHRAENFNGRTAAGLPAQIMKHLGVGVKTLAVDGAGPGDIRAKLKNRPDLMNGTQVIVWAFSTRHLSPAAINNWEYCDLPPIPVSEPPIVREPATPSLNN